MTGKRPAYPTLIRAGLIISLLTLTSVSRADDRSTGVSLPGLMAVPPGSVRATEAWIDLRGDGVTLRLQIRQTGKTAALRIQGPRFVWLGEAEPYPDRNFPELRATLDGSPLSDGSTAAIFMGQHNITTEIRDAGLDPFVIAETPPFVDRPTGHGQTAFDRLIGKHAVEREDNRFFARWSAQRLFEFNLGSNPASAFSVSYSARPGFALLALDDLERGLTLGSYCVTAPELRKWLTSNRRTEKSVVARNYFIFAGIDSQVPPDIRVHVADGNAVFCGSDGKAVFSHPNDVPVRARAGGGGVVRMLRLVSPG
jgi:hypothetical protein